MAIIINIKPCVLPNQRLPANSTKHWKMRKLTPKDKKGAGSRRPENVTLKECYYITFILAQVIVGLKKVQVVVPSARRQGAAARSLRPVIFAGSRFAVYRKQGFSIRPRFSYAKSVESELVAIRALHRFPRSCIFCSFLYSNNRI